MKTLHSLVSKIYKLRLLINSEHDFLFRTLTELPGSSHRLLDIGCGFASYYDHIIKAGVDYTGVDINKHTVEANKEIGRNVILPSELDLIEQKFDVLLMSHVIEHMDYQALIGFINLYTKRLKAGGSLIILSPLLHAGFYDDFDHVKPYNPAALRLALCQSNLQTQEFGVRDLFGVESLWIKRDPLGHFNSDSKLTHLVKIPLVMLYLFSMSILGKKTGYGMVFKKIGIKMTQDGSTQSSK